MAHVTMDMNEVSMLSDDLRPRDTPNHTLFKDFVLKPIVPDLSMTEESASQAQFSHDGDPRQLDAHSSGQRRQRPLLQECNTYSEWRKKSNQNAVTPASNFVNHYMGANLGGISKHTVLDTLNNSSTVRTFDMQPMLSSGPRQSNVKESGIRESSLQMSDEFSKKSPHQLETQARSAQPLRKEPLCVSGDKETHHSFGVPVKLNSRRSNSRSDSGSSSKSNKHHSNHPEMSNCVTCSHWPHQPMTTHSCNSMPVCHSFPHGLPSCNSVPRNLGMKSPSANASGNFVANSAHPHSDSIIYDSLYQIVLSQSEQLRSLQTQVEKLLVSQEHKIKGTCENSRSRCQGHEHCSCSVTFVEKSTQTSDSEMNLNDNEKMSIGVMTSFVHTVAYAGRVEVVDSRCKGMKQTNMNVNSHSMSPCRRSQPVASSLSSLTSDTPPQKCFRPMEGTDSHMDHLDDTLGGKTPGVSAAIRAVRGCQQIVATVSNACEAAQVDESITLNGLDLPTVVEPPVSPSASIHVDMQDYHSSSSDQHESSCSPASYTEDDSESRQTPNGWAFYQNVLGQVNQLLEDKDKGAAGGETRGEHRYSGKKKTDTHSDAVLKRVAFRQEAKRSEDDSADSFKQLALNYLRENHPEELASPRGSTGFKTPGAYRRVEDVGNNMSFATFRYLDRYNLLPENFRIKNQIEGDNRAMLTSGRSQNGVDGSSNGLDCRVQDKATRAHLAHHREKSRARHRRHLPQANLGNCVPATMSNGQEHASAPTYKILDITALRQQPKLL